MKYENIDDKINTMRVLFKVNKAQIICFKGKKMNIIVSLLKSKRCFMHKTISYIISNVMSLLTLDILKLTTNNLVWELSILNCLLFKTALCICYKYRSQTNIVNPMQISNQPYLSPKSYWNYLRIGILPTQQCLNALTRIYIVLKC